MYAEVELTDDIINFINDTKDHNESFEEIKELVFSDKMNSKEYSVIEMMKYSFMFQNIKTSAFNKVLRKEKLTYPEGMVFDRLLAKYANTLSSFEDHLKNIKTNSYTIPNKKEKARKILLSILNG